MGNGRSSPPGTCPTNEIKIITGLGKTGEGRLTFVFALHVLLDHQPVDKFRDDEQLRKPTDTTRIPPPSIKRLLVSERYCGKGKRDAFTWRK